MPNMFPFLPLRLLALINPAVNVLLEHMCCCVCVDTLLFLPPIVPPILAIHAVMLLYVDMSDGTALRREIAGPMGPGRSKATSASPSHATAGRRGRRKD